MQKENVDALLADLEANVKTSDTVYDVGTGCASERSLLLAFNANLLAVATAHARYVKTVSTTRDFSLTVSKSETYQGYKLRKLIWQNPHFFFSKILETIEADVRFSVGQRRLMAIVTKKITADVSISAQTQNERDAGVGAGGPADTAAADINAQLTNLASNINRANGGIAGIHFLMFPIERVEEFLFRVRPGINVGASSPDDNTPNVSTYTAYKRWHGHTEQQGDMFRNASRDFNISGNSTFRSHFNLHSQNENLAVEQLKPPTSGNSHDQTTENARPSGERVDEDFVFFQPNLNHTPFVDIDLSSMLNEFAMRQVTVAIRLKNEAGVPRSQGQAAALCLLRSVFQKKCYEATIRCLEVLGSFYSDGSQVYQDKRKARALVMSASILRNVRESFCIWYQILTDDTWLCKVTTPENIIIRMVATPSPRAETFFHYLWAENIWRQREWEEAKYTSTNSSDPQMVSFESKFDARVVCDSTQKWVKKLSWAAAAKVDGVSPAWIDTASNKTNSETLKEERRGLKRRKISMEVFGDDKIFSEANDNRSFRTRMGRDAQITSVQNKTLDIKSKDPRALQGGLKWARIRQHRERKRQWKDLNERKTKLIEDRISLFKTELRKRPIKSAQVGNLMREKKYDENKRELMILKQRCLLLKARRARLEEENIRLKRAIQTTVVCHSDHDRGSTEVERKTEHHGGGK